MVIKVIEDMVLWDNFVDSSPFGTLFHKWNFLEIIADYTNLALYRFGIYKKENLIAIFPFFYGRKSMARTFFSPPPDLAIPYLGFIVNGEFAALKQNKKESILEIIVNDVNEIIDKYPSDYLSIVLVPDFIDIREFQWSGYKLTPYYNYSVNISGDIKDILMNFIGNTRRIIKNISKEQLSLIQDEDLSFLFIRQNQRYNEQGINNPIQDIDYLLDIKNKFPNNIFCYKLSINNSLLSSILMIEYKKAVAWIGFSRPAKNNNDILIWEVIKNEKSKGYKEFELGGANTKRLCRYKSKFNPQLKTYYNIEKENSIGKLGKYVYKSFIKKKT